MHRPDAYELMQPAATSFDPRWGTAYSIGASSPPRTDTDDSQWSTVQLQACSTHVTNAKKVCPFTGSTPPTHRPCYSTTPTRLKGYVAEAWSLAVAWDSPGFSRLLDAVRPDLYAHMLTRLTAAEAEAGSGQWWKAGSPVACGPTST